MPPQPPGPLQPPDVNGALGSFNWKPGQPPAPQPLLPSGLKLPDNSWGTPPAAGPNPFAPPPAQPPQGPLTGTDVSRMVPGPDASPGPKPPGMETFGKVVDAGRFLASNLWDGLNQPLNPRMFAGQTPLPALGALDLGCARPGYRGRCCGQAAECRQATGHDPHRARGRDPVG